MSSGGSIPIASRTSAAHVTGVEVNPALLPLAGMLPRVAAVVLTATGVERVLHGRAIGVQQRLDAAEVCEAAGV